MAAGDSSGPACEHGATVARKMSATEPDRTSSRQCEMGAAGGVPFFVLILSSWQCISCCSHGADIFTPIHGGRRAPLVRTMSGKVKHGLGRVCPDRLRRLRELTTAICFDTLAR